MPAPRRSKILLALTLLALQRELQILGTQMMILLFQAQECMRELTRAQSSHTPLLARTRIDTTKIQDQEHTMPFLKTQKTLQGPTPLVLKRELPILALQMTDCRAQAQACMK